MNIESREPGGPLVRRPLYDEVAERLRHRIQTRQLQQGERLDELTLCRELGVSRTPLREALKVLEREGLVKLVPRRGCFVMEITGKDLANIFSILMDLEQASAIDAAQRVTDADLRRLKRILRKLEAHAAAQNVPAYMEANHELHEVIHEISDNPWRAEIIRDMRRLQGQFRYRSLNLAGRLQQSLEEHRLLIPALEKRDAAAAGALMRKHVENQWLAMHRAGDVPMAQSEAGQDETRQGATA